MNHRFEAHPSKKLDQPERKSSPAGRAKQLMKAIGLVAAMGAPEAGCVVQRQSTIERPATFEQQVSDIESYYRGVANFGRQWLYEPSQTERYQPVAIKPHFWEQFHFHEASLSDLIQRGYPRFMTDAGNVRQIAVLPHIAMLEGRENPRDGIRYVSMGIAGVTRTPITLEENNISTHPAEVYLTRGRSTHGYGVEGARRFDELLGHELGHVSSPFTVHGMRIDRRIYFLRRLIGFTSDPRTIPPLPNTRTVHHENVGRHRFMMADEFHADAITLAIHAHVNPGETWREAYARELQEQFHMDASQSRDVADYAIEYITENDPSFDQARAEQSRQEVYQRLAQESSDRFWFIEDDDAYQDVQRIHQRIFWVINRALSTQEGAISNGNIHFISYFLSDRNRLIRFIAYPTLFSKAHHRHDVIPGLSPQVSEQAAEAWENFLDTLMRVYQDSVEDKGITHQSTQERSPENTLPRAIERLERVLRSILSSPQSIRAFQRWANEYLEQRVVFEVPRGSLD